MAATKVVPSNGEYSYAEAVTPADSELTTRFRALYIGTAGTLKVTTTDGVVVTFGAVAAGLLPVCVKQVWTSGTSAQNIVGLR